MVELTFFVVLLLLPINVTPAIAVWFYEKLLFLSSPLLSVFEAVHIVLFIMKASQLVVDRIEEQPNLAKVKHGTITMYNGNMLFMERWELTLNCFFSQ
jgi:hypothetical protein